MQWASVLFPLLLVVLALANDEGEVELPLAGSCDEEACQLPDCRCSSTSIPGGLAPRDTPQFVLVTFDGNVNSVNIESYRSILYNRVNRNRCPAGATFFVSHEYTDYHLVNELYNRGFEIGLHSISRRTPQSIWATASYQDLVLEIADQRILTSHFANIPSDEIKGVRMPFFQLAGNTSFQVMADYRLTYDASWSTATLTNPGLWTYTLDYESIQDCQILPCPTASIPGVWVSPIITWLDLEGFPCATVEACIFPPDREDEEAWLRFIVVNFERHYLNNRAPFSVNINTAYFNIYPAVRNAFVRFLDLINSLNDVFMVNTAEVVEWVKDPIPVNEYLQKPCRSFSPAVCDRSWCVSQSELSQQTYYLQICNIHCPRTYPWVGNPLGQ